MTTKTYSVQSVHKTLLDTFHQYLSAQYHIWDESLISERNRIFNEVGNTHQEPRLEATPQYAEGPCYSDLNIPTEAKSILECASNERSTGIPRQAYIHQCRAVEHFLRGKDLIVATGTGSGKTESFLMPILSNLAIESTNRSHTWLMPGIRALLLYPMNALVNDQLGRLRRLLGNAAVIEAISGKDKRNPRFGMYTSRSPYPGLRNKKKDKNRVEMELSKLYFNDMTNEYRERLESEGKWPAKDLEDFIANNLDTGISDVELLTRHEMQNTAPDLLVTNYSMLEYMMLRPIEAPIFTQTSEWLAADDANKFTVVIDEAHMYRGSGGAEVAYLLRRLQSRLGVSRDRIQFILTSASMGPSEDAISEITEFAAKLTGGKSTGFKLITGKLDQRPTGAAANAKTQTALAKFDYSPLLDSTSDLANTKSNLSDLAHALKIKLNDPPLKHDGLQQYAFDLLSKLPVAFLVAHQLTNIPTTISDCAEIAFPNADDGKQSLETLIALMAFAKDHTKGLSRPFCPIRSHLFFRGLPGLYACTNVECKKSDSVIPNLLGRLHPTEKLQCECGARVYELLTHRSCGAAYLRAYMKGLDGDFLWHQPSMGTWTDTQLAEAQFYVIPEHELNSVQGIVVWLHTLTGKLLTHKPAIANKGDYLALLRPDTTTRDRGRYIFSLSGNCRSCGQRTRPDTPIAMDLATKGEAPFAHILREQIATQPTISPPTRQTPNGGRKTIIFSDGRQKAARLARDVPREIELDIFRQTLFMASSQLQNINMEPRLNRLIYTAFLKCLDDYNLRFFDGDDRAHVEGHLREFQDFYASDLASALDDENFKPPPSFWAILLKQLGTPFYSISALTLGYAAPCKSARNRILKEIPHEEVDAIAVAWIQRLLTRFAFGRDDVSDGVRRQASRYPLRPVNAGDGFSKSQKDFLSSQELNVDQIAECLGKNLCDTKPDGSLYLKPSHLILRSALSEKWVQCEKCKTVSPALIHGNCPNCMLPGATLVDPNTTSYLRARKGFWRDPVAKAVSGALRPMSIDVQEHSAQLSYKDADNPAPTTEVFERQFRDILRPGERAIDILSCTTTMEVGIDIGSLIAVSMRNVPPMRQNYQQRSGRAGRRGSAVSTVVTYAQSGAHDSFYFLNPDKILAGDPPKPVLDTQNQRIAVRHVFAQLLQDFFRPITFGHASPDIFTVLGDTWNFFNTNSQTSLVAFKRWVRESDEGKQSLQRAQAWLPELIDAIEESESIISELEERSPKSQEGIETSLIEFLFAHGLLPSYAFPTDLCSLQIQESVPGRNGSFRVVEQAQQGLNIALSEYAPGRLIVLNKKTYRIGTVAASGPDTEVDRATALFNNGKVYRHCTQCSYTAGFIQGDDGKTTCPQCQGEALRTMTVIRPETVFPSGRREIDEFDDEQIFSQVTKAQLPLPDNERKLNTEPFGMKGGLAPRRQQRLVVINEGDISSTDIGFRICSKCGKVLTEGELEGPHSRDYYIRNHGQPYPYRCDGEFKNVFLGYEFTSDILLLRTKLNKPLRFDIITRRYRKPLEDALQTLCEALTLSIGRVLDVDPNEVSAGFRLGNDGTADFADIFIYDTLSGGAGYALQAGSSFADIFGQAKKLLSDCTCTTSCENCLRHYGNRFNHASLDRQLGLDLANYIEFGEVPEDMAVENQMQVLEPLAKMVRLAGWKTEIDNQGYLVSNNGRWFRLTSCPSLRACNPKSNVNKTTVLTFTPYELSRDLPSAFAELI